VNACVEQNCVTVLKQIELTSHLCFIPLPTALFDGVMCVFRAQNNKSNDLYFWRWLSVTGERETEQDKSMQTVRCVWACLLQFKDTRSVSSIDVDLLYSLPVTLRQQHCWEFASCRINVAHGGSVNCVVKSKNKQVLSTIVLMLDVITS
jgi:hypothetical protein